MCDLVERLRDQQTKWMTPILGQAADRIADLETEVARKVRVKPLVWPEGESIARPAPYQIWTNNGGSGAPDDPLIHYENFAAFDPNMNLIGEYIDYEDAQRACNEHFEAFIRAVLEWE